MFSSTKHVVIDIETLSLSTRALVRSIGIAVFNPWDDEPPHTQRFVLCSSSQSVRGEIDFETVKWWLAQGDAARSAMIADGEDEIYPFDVATRLAEYAGHVVWCKPLHFDVPILLDLFRFYGIKMDGAGDLLYRRSVHNARTIYEAASLLGAEVKEEPELHGIDRGELHRPEVDAKLTAYTVRRALRVIRGDVRDAQPATSDTAIGTSTWSSGPTQEPIQPLLRDALNALRENLSSTQTRARAVSGGWMILVISGGDEAVATIYTSGKATTGGPDTDLRRNVRSILSSLGYDVTC